MKFSEHLGKGVWAFASRGLPAIYGIVTIFIIRSLPLNEFGVYFVFQSVFALIFTFADTFALQAIVKIGVEPDTDLQELLSATGALFLGFMVIAITVLMAGADTWGSILKSPGLPSLLPLMGVLIFASIPRTLFSKVLQMRFHVKEIFFVDFAYFGLCSIAIPILIYRGLLHNATDLVIVTISASLTSSLVAFFFVRGTVALTPRFTRTMARRVWDYGKYQSGTGLASALVAQLDTILVSSFTGEVGAGIYGASKQPFKAYDAIRDTQTLFIFPASSKYYSRKEFATLRTMLEKAVSFLYLILIPMSVLLVIFAPQLFHLLFKGKYDASVPIFRVLACGSIILPIQMVFGTSMVGFGRMREYFRVMSTSFAINIIVALILLPQIGIIGAAVGYICGLVAQAVQFYLIVKPEIGISPKALFTRGFFDIVHYVQAKFGRAK